MPQNKCLKCNQSFKNGEEYVEVSNNPKSGTYHKKCWAEVEKEQQNNNNYHTCQECKKTIKAGEEYAKETMPDAFSPHDVYYHKSCFKKTQCSKCSNPRLEGRDLCFDCSIRQNNRANLPSFLQNPSINNNNNDDDIRERERERAKSENSSFKCHKCSNPLTNHKSWCPKKCNKCNDLNYNRDSSKCYNKNCENYYQKRQSNSKFKKGKCRQCLKSNVLIDNNGLCFKCVLDNMRLEFREIIKKIKAEGISSKEIQKEWENTFKPQMEEALRNAKQYQVGLTEEEKREGERMAQELIETIESEIYPDRKKKKGGSAWIWILIIVGVAIVGLVSFVWYKKKKK